MHNSTPTTGLSFTGQLDELYYDNPHIAIRYRTRADMRAELQAYAARLAAQEQDPLRRYLLSVRCEYLLQEALAASPTELYRVLCGISYLTPHTIKRLVDDTGINIFLARDAAADYIAARLLNDL